jgi:serine/threonine protein kinase
LTEERDTTLKNPNNTDTVATVACPKCGLAVASGTRFCPNDATPIGEQDRNRTVPGYKFTKLIGSGGMGDVYAAEHLILGKLVAIKTLKSHLLETSAFQRFQKEAQAASSLTHPNIVKVYDCGISQTGEPYMVMDLVKGETLAQYLKTQGALSITESIQIITEVCNGVICAHDQNILHRDLKPSNVILEESGEKRIARVLDFGIAKILENEDLVSKVTKTGEVMGTPTYMSPEQVNGNKLDQRSDVYSIGCMFYEMLTGSPPILGKSALETMVRHLNEKPLSLSQAALKPFPEALEKIVSKMLAKDPAARHQNLKEFLAELGAYQMGVGKRTQGPDFKDTSDRQVFVIPLIATICALLIVCASLLYLINTKKAENKIETATTPIPSPEAISNQDDSVKRNPISAGETDVFFRQYLMEHSHDGTIDVGRMGDARDFTDISDRGLAPLSKFYQLGTLNLDSCQNITVKGLENLVGLPGLTNLELADTNLGDEIFPLLERMHLGTINLARTKITDQGLLSVKPDLSIVDLGLKNTKISDQGMKNIGRLKNLKKLNVDICHAITDDGIAEISKLNINTLRLREAGITGRAANSIVKMKGLTELNCGGTDLDDEALQKLSHMKGLTSLNIAECPKISLSAIEKFKLANPNCKLETKRSQ